MGIYRGIGGTGDSTSDATLEAVTQKAVEADASADAAAISETNAASSASSAQTYAGNASTSATAASSSVASAATSAATSTSSATTATTKASEAATSATNAASSATSAATSASTATTAKDAALAALDSFDDKYLGAKASDPSVDNDGNALSQGTLYYNTTSDVMKVYNGSVWIATYVSLSGALLSSNNLSDVTSASSSRTNLGLGTIATQAANNVNITGGSISSITDLAVVDGGTGASTASGARTNLGLVIGTDVLAPNGSAASLTSFPTLNQNTTGTASNVTGTVAIANGGTGATTAGGALTALGAYAASNPSGYTSNTGTVTSVGGTGTINGLSLSGTVTSSGNITLGGTLDLSSPPAIGGTTPAAGTFTTLTAQTEVLKGTGQNYLTYSQTFQNSVWVKQTSVTATDNATTAPDGSSTAASIAWGSAANNTGIYQTQTVSFGGSANIKSIYIRADVAGGTVTIQDPGFGSGVTTLTLTTSWQRVTLTESAQTSVAGIWVKKTASSPATIYIWGAQLERGSTVNTYVPTTTAAIYGIPSLSFSGVAGIGLQSDGSLYETSAGTGNVRFYTNNIAQEQMRVSHTASAVNYVQVTGAATGGAPAISAQGSDSNANIWLASKGTGFVGLYTSGTQPQLLVTHTASVANWMQITGATASNAPRLSVAGSDTNIPLVLQPKGTGALQAQQTDSTATGGNARGANAVDWQTSRGSANQVASAPISSILGGTNNRASGYASVVVGGFQNTSTGVESFSGAGLTNTAQGDYTAIVSGASNTAGGNYNFIGGGFTNSGTANAAVTTQSGTMNGTTAVTLSGSNASIKVGQYIGGTSIASDTYVAAISGTSLTLSKVASGSSTSTLSFYTPHGVVVGGGNNQATGSYSFIGGGGDAGTAANRNVASGDWSTVGGGAKNVASGAGSVIAGGGVDGGNLFGSTSSGSNSFIGGGILNNATNTGSVVTGGWQNTASGNLSTVVGGRFGSARGISGIVIFPACSEPVVGASGASQGSLLILGRQTTDATPTVLRSDVAAAGTTNQVILPNNSAYFFKGEVVAGVTGGGNTKGWTVEGVIKRGANAASTAIVGTATVVSAYGDAGAATWTITALADTTNGGLKITATGQAATTIRWVCKIETTEMTY